MGKVFAVIVVVIALASAIPIITHNWFGTAIQLAPPEDISTHGHAIDEQLSETMVEAGLSFLAAQLVLAFFVWKFSARPADAEIKSFPGGAKWMVVAAMIFVGTEIVGPRCPGPESLGRPFTSLRPSRMPCRFRRRPASSLSTSAIPVSTASSGDSHPDKIDEGNANFFGLDPANDVDARDDIVVGGARHSREPRSASAHACEGRGPFFLRSRAPHPAGLRSRALSFPLHFTATRSGKYEIVCTQLCGLGHYNMKAYLSVLSQDDFDSG